MRLAFWPGLGSGDRALDEVAPVLDAAGIDLVTLDPRYGGRTDWSIDTLGDELAATGAEVYGGASWGGAVAATAALRRPPRALVLVDGGHVGTGDVAPDTPARAVAIRNEHETLCWPSRAAYLDWARARGDRWNEVLEAIALSHVRETETGVVPAFAADEVDAIMRAYDAFDVEALGGLRPSTRVLLVLAGAAGDTFADRFAVIVPQAEIRRVDCGHDVVRHLGPALGEMLAEWLTA